MYFTNYYEGQEQDGTARIPIKLKIKEDDKLKNKKLRVAREIRRSGSMRRKRRGAASRAYIVGVRYYHGNMLMSADHYGSGAQQQRMYWRTRRDSSRVCFFSSFPFPFENSLCFFGILALHYYCEEMIQPFLVNHILQEPSGEYNLVPKNFIKIFKNL